MHIITVHNFTCDSIHDLHSDQNICPNIGKLHLYLNCDIYNEETLVQINILLNNVSEEEIITDGKFAQHPFLHELCHQYNYSFPLLIEVWKKPVFQKYWDNVNYLDKYYNTALKRLSICLFETKENSGKIKWIKENMKVIPCLEEIDGMCNGKYLVDMDN
jgi:hypothetical protein